MSSRGFWLHNTMPFSMLMTGYPTQEIAMAQAQGPALQGMFLHLLESVDPGVAQRLHVDNRYRPYTLSPLEISVFTQGQSSSDFSRAARGRTGKPAPGPFQAGSGLTGKFREIRFDGFRLPGSQQLQPGDSCSVRITLLEDGLFPTFSRYFLTQAEPTFRLGSVDFQVTNVLVTGDNGNFWSRYTSYSDLIMRAARQGEQRRIALRFLSPTSFRNGDVDLPLPLPRLVFQSYFKRFCEFYPVEFLPEFEDLVERYTGIGRMDWVRTEAIKTKRIVLAGFTGDVTFQIDQNAPADLVRQMNLLADFAFFCGTGRKTSIGLGQTVRRSI